MPGPIRKFSARERALVAQTIKERSAAEPVIEEAEAELQLDLLKQELSSCPSLHWQEDDANYVIFKIADNRFRAQFYYLESEQFGTSEEEYSNLGDCIIALLQCQADYQQRHRRLRAGLNAVDFSKANDGEEYHAPIII